MRGGIAAALVMALGLSGCAVASVGGAVVGGVAEVGAAGVRGAASVGSGAVDVATGGD